MTTFPSPDVPSALMDTGMRIIRPQHDVLPVGKCHFVDILDAWVPSTFGRGVLAITLHRVG